MSGIFMLLALLAMAAGAAIYFLPTIIAKRRGKTNFRRHIRPQSFSGLYHDRLGRGPECGR